MQLIYLVDATVVIALALSVTVFLRAACRWNGSIIGEVLDRAFIFGLIVSWLVINGRHPLAFSYLELMGLIAALALSIGSWPLRALLYYGTILLSLQLFLSPRFDLAPLQMAFWFHWIGHAGVLAAVIYDLRVNRYRPRWRDGLFACLMLSVCDAMMPIDLPLKINHLILLFAIFVIATLPWHWIRRSRPPRPIPKESEFEDDTELIYST